MKAPKCESTASGKAASADPARGTTVPPLSARLGKRLLAFAQRPLLVGAFLFLAALAIYAPALSGEPLWDDLYLIGENPFFKSPVFFLEVFRNHLFLDSFSVYYRPVQNLSYMLDYWLWNRNPFGYHLANVCFHAASGFLLFLLLRQLIAPLMATSTAATAKAATFAPPTSAPAHDGCGIGHPVFPSLVALFVAAAWVVHPIHNAAVAYISGRADSLAMLFAVGAWLMRLAAIRSATVSRRFALNGGAMLLVLLALCTKEIAAVWMALFVAHLFAVERRVNLKSRLATVAVLLALLAAYWGLRNLPDARVVQVGVTPSPFPLRVLLMLRALGDYTGLIFFPKNLHMERIVWNSHSHGSSAAWQANIAGEYLTLFGLLTIAAFVWLSLRRGAGQPLRLLGAAWFAIGFLPISNLFPLNAQSAEHWIYMPSIGFLLFVAGCLVALPPRWHAALAGAACAAILLLGVRTSLRSDDWSSPEKFLTRTILAGGGTCRIHVNLAVVLLSQNKLDAAEKVLRRTMELFPTYTTARITLGQTLLRAGRAEEAAPYLHFSQTESDEMARSFPGTWSAALNLAHIRHEAGKPAEALAILDDAITRYPEIWPLVRLQSFLLEKMGDRPAAIRSVERFAEAQWWNYDVQMALGRMHASGGAADAAIAAFRQAGRLDIHAVEPLNLLARVQLDLGRADEAFRTQQAALRRDPEQPRQYLLLAAILAHLDRTDEAAQALRQAENLRKNVSAHSS